MDLKALDQFLSAQSYIGSAAGVTLEDYAKCKTITASDAAKHPHVARWHGHVSYLMERFPSNDWRGNPIPKGTPMGAGPAPAAGSASAPKASPKQKPEKPAEKPAAKKEAKGKKEEAAPAAGGGAIDEAAIKKVGDDIRAVKEKLKAEGKSGKEVNNDPEVQKLVEMLAKLKKGEAVPGAGAAAKPAKAEPTPEEKRKAKLKKVIKEGGKRGVEIEGAADMGGLGFFCTSVDEPEGDIELTDECMKAMNAESDPTEEERKGGSGKIGKMIFSAGVEALAIVAYVPDDKKGDIDCKEWLNHVIKMCGAGKVLSANGVYGKATVPQDSNKGIFPLKVKDTGITEAIQFLKKKGLFPDKDDSDDEFVFGDDDFPDAADY